MDPWLIIGWLLLAVFVGIPLLAFVGGVLSRLVCHLLTRNTPPAKGQRWMQEGSELHITDIYDNGRIGMKSYGGCSTVSWSDSPEEWRRRVRGRWLYLVEAGLASAQP